MSGGDFSFDMQLTGGQADSTDQTRYMAPPFDARMISGEKALLLNSRDNELRKLPLSLVRILGLCDRFRTLDEHTRHIARKLELPDGQYTSLEQTLRQAAREKLLKSERDVFGQLVAKPASTPADTSIETLFVRTCARPDTLERLLESIERHENTTALKRCVVLDDDHAGTSARETAAVVARCRERLPIDVHHVTPGQRRTLLEYIASRSDASSEDLIWCIEGDEDDNRPSYGSSLNLALLLGAGEKIALIDDDATLEAFRLETSGEAVRFCPFHSAKLAFPEPGRELETQFTPLTDHPVKLHDRYLGHTGDELARTGEDDLGGLFAELDPQVLFELGGGSRVRVTSNGTLGDPGTSGIQWLFTESAENLQPLFASEERYRELIGQRLLARSPQCVQASTAINLMTTTLTGIDNRELLLPTQARGGNEDLLFGALVAYLHPGSLHLGLPHMLLHMRPEPRKWQESDLDRARTTNQGRYLADQIEQLARRTPGSDVQSRLQILKGWMENLASLDASSLTWRLHQDLLELRASTIEAMRNARESFQPAPWLVADLDRAMAAHSTITDQTRRSMDRLADRLPVFAGRYAGSLPGWDRAWHYCRDTGIDTLLEYVARQ